MSRQARKGGTLTPERWALEDAVAVLQGAVRDGERECTLRGDEAKALLAAIEFIFPQLIPKRWHVHIDVMPHPIGHLSAVVDGTAVGVLMGLSTKLADVGVTVKIEEEDQHP